MDRQTKQQVVSITKLIKFCQNNQSDTALCYRTHYEPKSIFNQVNKLKKKFIYVETSYKLVIELIYNLKIKFFLRHLQLANFLRLYIYMYIKEGSI